MAREPFHGAVAVGGYEEVVAVYNDTVAYSSCNSMAGPFATLPELPDGVDDITDLVDAAREQMPMHEHLPMLDPPVHTDHRALLMRLITPKRLAENEEFLWRLADVQIDEFAAAGPLRVHPRVLQPVQQPRDHRPPRRARRGPRHDPAATRDARARRGRHHGRAVRRAGLPLRAVHRVRRGPAGQPARRRAHRPGHRDVPRRLHAGGDRRRAHRGVPLRRRRRDHRAPARGRTADHRRGRGAPAASARRPEPAPRLHRGGAAARGPGQDRPPPHPPGHVDRRGADRAGRHRRAAARRREPRPAPVR